MAVLSDYTSGTITVAQNSVNFTGTDTLWRTMRFREGDTVQLQGYTMVIKGIDEPGQPIESNTSGQFTEPWPGAGGTFEYRMRFLPDNARVSGQSAELIELLGNGILDNIASVPVEDGKLLVGNASGQYEPISKDELGTPDPNGSLGKLAALTLAARQILQTDATGDLKQVALVANKFLRTNSSADVSLGDLTDFGAALLALTGTNGNIPVMTGAGTVSSRPIVGTVSQSGGVPTGAIIERGSNANGEYVKYADGTLICTRSISYSSISITSASNGIFFGPPEVVKQFPAAFISEPTHTSVFLNGWIMWAVCDGIPTTTQWPAWYPFSDQAKTNQPARAKYAAIGRWF